MQTHITRRGHLPLHRAKEANNEGGFPTPESALLTPNKVSQTGRATAPLHSLTSKANILMDGGEMNGG